MGSYWSLPLFNTPHCWDLWPLQFKQKKNITPLDLRSTIALCTYTSPTFQPYLFLFFLLSLLPALSLPLPTDTQQSIKQGIGSGERLIDSRFHPIRTCAPHHTNHNLNSSLSPFLFGPALALGERERWGHEGKKRS